MPPILLHYFQKRPAHSLQYLAYRNRIWTCADTHPNVSTGDVSIRRRLVIPTARVHKDALRLVAVVVRPIAAVEALLMLLAHVLHRLEERLGAGVELLSVPHLLHCEAALEEGGGAGGKTDALL
jgi:hypothetical protein